MMTKPEDQLFGQKKLFDSQAALMHAQKVAGVHGQFLEIRHQSLQQLADLLATQIETGRRAGKRQPKEKLVLLGLQQLDEFAQGSLVACLGEEYKVFAGRRTPRIPNGDLMLISRVLEIVGRRGEVDQPSKIYSEYDVPEDAWFFRDNSYSSIPLSILMEIALQPCGVLSAYMGTMLLFPDHEFYFRNLDGQATLLREIDLRGRTISCQATMTSSIVSGETIIQKFTFVLSCNGEGFYQGESVFGYFPPQMMLNQAGLDRREQILPWHEESKSKVNEPIGFAFDDAKAVQKFYKQPLNHLNLISKQLISADGGHFGKGYVFASDRIDPNDWFYACHFFQDPVMPGSLGVEAMVQAMQTLVLEKKLCSGIRSPRFTLEVGQPMVWKYRGQITPANQMMSLEVHIHDIRRETDKILVSGNASLWADKKRIYEVHDIALCIIEEG